MSNIGELYKGGCHCGAVQFEAIFDGGLGQVLRCNCSICRMRGAVVCSTSKDKFKILQGHDMLTSYRFNTGVAEHFFCSRCGIYTHHQKRSDSTQYGVNAACLAGVSPFDFLEVPVTDGIHHTKDTGKPEQLAGTLRFIPVNGV